MATIVVVSDTSPIRALYHLNRLPLCRELYGSVIVPDAVSSELRHATTRCSALEIADYPFFDVRRPTSEPGAVGVPADLDPGETEATLAVELRADLVLMDERRGRTAAKQMNVNVIGVIGVLLESKRRGLVAAVLPAVDRLINEQGFFISAQLRRQIAALAGE